ncbi:MAG: biopolymer transporter ExbD [Gemmatimonadota bacterium]|nr:biopolymer transporter ExbD [Gemmatimonadota bacterium]
MPRRRGRGREMAASADINVTALVDVALTLLVIFLITAPMMQAGVEVSIPRAPAAPLEANDGVVVSVDRAGNIFVGERPTPWPRFESVFTGAVLAAGAGNVYLRADQGVPYGRVMQVLAAMKSADVASVGLVAEAEVERP